jgi:hypothetical protein
MGGAVALPPGDPNLPRGIRNNNPLNLTYVEGQPGVQGSDGRFGRYGSMEDGIAASVRQLQMYGQRGLTTLPQIIGRWAPASENNVGAYVQSVARASGLPADRPIDLNDPAVVARLVGAMAQHENGRGVDPAAIRRGVEMAFGRGGASGGGQAPPAAPGAGNPSAAVAALDGQIAALQRVGSERSLAIARQLEHRRDQLIASASREPPETWQTVEVDQGDGRRVPIQRSSRGAERESPRAAPAAPALTDGQARNVVGTLAERVASGQATPEEARRYIDAAEAVQTPRWDPQQNTSVAGRLPAYAPEVGWVQQRYGLFRPNDPRSQAAQRDAATTPAAAGAGGAGAGGRPAMEGDAITAAKPPDPPLPPAPGSRAGGPPPGDGGPIGTPRPAMEGGTRRDIEERQTRHTEGLARLTDIQASYRPEFQQFLPRLSARWASIRERAGADLAPRDRAQLEAFSQYRASAFDNLNETIRAVTGSAMGVAEAERIIATMPNPGTGVFDGDSPTEFKAKMDRAIEATRNALIRANYAQSRGLNPTETGIELHQVPRLFNRRGMEIAAEIRRANPSMQSEEVQRQTRARLRQEFGI